MCEADMSTFGKRQGGGRRVAARRQAPLVAVFTTVTRANRGTVIDVSRTGIRLLTRYPPLLEEEIMVSIEAVRTFGKVAWCSKEQFGVEFDSPLDDATVELLRRKGAEAAGMDAETKLALDIWMGRAPR
jgi:hypothetical protein